MERNLVGCAPRVVDVPAERFRFGGSQMRQSAKDICDFLGCARRRKWPKFGDRTMVANEDYRLRPLNHALEMLLHFEGKIAE
jgi:hypothetical protein